MTERQGPRVTFDKKKPAYYQAGRGRGALGFGTSSALPFSDTKSTQRPLNKRPKCNRVHRHSGKRTDPNTGSASE